MTGTYQQSQTFEAALPAVIAGPILRHTSQSEFTVWLVTAMPLDVDASLKLWTQTTTVSDQMIHNNTAINVSSLQVGGYCWIHLIAQQDLKLPTQEAIYYDLVCHKESLFSAQKDTITYQHEQHPSFFAPQKLECLWHGSCRKPHHHSDDALVTAAKNLEAIFTEQAVSHQPVTRPDAFFMTGDQIYCDDVASPMLLAIHQVMAALELFDEQWEDAKVDTTKALLQHPYCYNNRHQLLPDDVASQALHKQFFRGARKPIFTSSNAYNHSITLSEIIAQYLLVWSDIPWQFVNFEANNAHYQKALKSTFSQKDQESAVFHTQQLKRFKMGLKDVRKLLAHLPIYMIFDDHDVTDDWNLTRGWEEAAYSNGFSKRIIGNALLAYGLCQGSGNAPKQHWPLLIKAKGYFESLVKHNQLAGSSNNVDDNIQQHHDQLIDDFLAWSQWGYLLNTRPKIVVLDTRTHRWRSESDANKPSGLMDWESLTNLQQQIINEEQVIIVSAAPMFGVKIIESIQKFFSFLGYPLLVDAENWMAHPGAASVLLNIFKHKKTPPHFMILSGDVHYSFVYDITIRRQNSGEKITQITASGLKNTFPQKLLTIFEALNHYLYASWSPLNWFTKRRSMRIKSRCCNYDSQQNLLHRELLNVGGYGEILLTQDLANARVRVIAGEQIVEFKRRD